MIKARWVNVERVIGTFRYATALMGDYTMEMALFMQLAKGMVEARIKNDGFPPSVAEEAGKLNVSRIQVGSYRTYKVTQATFRAVLHEIRGFKRVTEAIWWKPLAPFTLWDREQKGFPYSKQYPRLFRTGEMLDSITGKRNIFGHYEYVWKTGFEFGAKNKVAAINNKWRPFIYLSSDFFFFLKKFIKIRTNTVFRFARAKAMKEINRI